MEQIPMKSIHQVDFSARADYYQQFMDACDVRQLETTFFINEASFHLSGYINCHDMRKWSTENPRVYVKAPLHSKKKLVFELQLVNDGE